jgi:hypothetical protein
MRPKTRFDMGDRDRPAERRKRCRERARRIALHDNQVGRGPELAEHRGGHGRDVPVRVLLAGAVEIYCREVAKPEILSPELRMLAGEDERRRYASLGEGDRNRSQFYRFGPGADDQPDVGETQPSP